MVTPVEKPTDVLVLGASGRVGEALGRLLPGYGFAVRSVSRKAATPDTAGVDVCDQNGLVACIEEIDPRVVVYAAAVADPDRCEDDPSTSYAVNVIGAGWVAEAAAKTGRRVVYYSSDYVFGQPGRYLEDAPVMPLQVYGRHKAEAEKLVLSQGDNMVIRLPMLFGSRDFVAETVEALVRKTPLVRDDRRRYPISVEHVARVTGTVITPKAPPGIYHAAGVDAVTKSEWAAYIAGLLGKALPPAAVSTTGPIARRPLDIELATRHRQMRTRQGELWAATRARVAELAG